jgi:hypothetical protein
MVARKEGEKRERERERERDRERETLEENIYSSRQ